MEGSTETVAPIALAAAASTVGMDIRVVNITPEMAKKWLEHGNNKNRKMSKPKVAALAKEMRSGNWKLTHQGIAFDSTGRLLDGQHRLQAIIDAKATVEIVVSKGMDPSSMLAVDLGVRRRRADYFEIFEEVKDANRKKEPYLAIRYLESESEYVEAVRFASFKVTDESLRDYYIKYGTELDILCTKKRRCNLKGSAIAAFIYFAPINPENIWGLFDGISEKKNIPLVNAFFAANEAFVGLSGATGNCAALQLALATIRASLSTGQNTVEIKTRSEDLKTLKAIKAKT